MIRKHSSGIIFRNTKMQTGLVVFVLACSTVSAYTLYDRCVKQCDNCLEFWGGNLFDARVCKTYCALTKGGSGNSAKCTFGAKMQKRVKSHPGTMECQKYCMGCIELYGKSNYDGYKCSIQCIESQGKTTDNECVIYSMFGK